MIDGTSRHFDARRSGSTIEATAALIGAQWRVFTALIVIASLLEALAFASVYVDTVGARSVRASIASITLFVAVDAQASNSDVDALGPRITATPGIGAAALRSKDDAIKALVAKGMPATDGRNPLPDVWVVHLDPSAATGSDARTVEAVAADARRALGSLPHVDSVTIDAAWVAIVDGVVGRWTRQWPVVRRLGLFVVAIVLACTAYLASRAVGPVVDDPGPLRVLTLTSVVAALSSLAISLGAFFAVVREMNVIPVAPLQDLFPAWNDMPSEQLVFLGIASLLVIAVAFSLGRHRNK